KSEIGKQVAGFFDVRLAFTKGQIRHAHELIEQLSDINRRMGAVENAAGALVYGASFDALYGLPLSAAKEKVNEALKATQGPGVLIDAALAFALIGDSRAENLIDQASKSRPNDTNLQFSYIPRVRAGLALRHGDDNKALQLMEPARAYDQGDNGSLYLRGTIYLKLARYNDAIGQFQRILDMGAVQPEDPVLVMARLGIARAAAGSGDKAKARQMYQDVLATWKDADPDVPLIRDAKTEYAKLQ